MHGIFKKRRKKKKKRKKSLLNSSCVAKLSLHFLSRKPEIKRKKIRLNWRNFPSQESRKAPWGNCICQRPWSRDGCLLINWHLNWKTIQISILFQKNQFISIFIFTMDTSLRNCDLSHIAKDQRAVFNRFLSTISTFCEAWQFLLVPVFEGKGLNQKGILPLCTR